MKILICDDDKEIAKAIGIYLRNAGYETVEVHDWITLMQRELAAPALLRNSFSIW